MGEQEMRGSFVTSEMDPLSPMNQTSLTFYHEID